MISAITRRDVLLRSLWAAAGAGVGRLLLEQRALATDLAASQPTLRTVGAEDAFGGQRIHLEFAGRPAFIIQPVPSTDAKPRQWVWFAPTLPGYPGARHDYFIRRALKADMAVAGIDVGESFGSPTGVKLYADFHDALVPQFHLTPKAVLLPQSRGGLMLYNWGSAFPQYVERIAGIYPVCDLRSYPGLKVAAPAYQLTEQQLAAALPQYNPIDHLQPLVQAGIPILHIHGDNDHVVPLEKNSAELQRRYRALGGKMRLIIVPGKGHEEVDEFFTSDAFATFLTTGQ